MYLSIMLHAGSNNGVDLKLELVYGCHCGGCEWSTVVDDFEDVRR